MTTSQEIKVGDLGKIITGKTPSTKVSEYFGGDYLFVTPSDLDFMHYYCEETITTVSDEAKNRHINQFIPAESVMFTCIGNTIGKCAIAIKECLTNQQINSIVPYEKKYTKWERAQFKEEMEKSRKHYDRKFDTTLGALGARWGLRSEASFRNGLKGILEDVDLKVEHFEEYDDECIVHDRPGPVEMDIIIKNGLLMLCELKASMSRADMFEFYKKTVYYEKKHNRKGDRLIVISPMVDPKAREVADELGIKIYSFAEDIQEEIT